MWRFTQLIGGAVLAAVAVAGSGCGLFDRSAKTIAEMRRSGQSLEARQKALELLEDDADRMDLWRELVYCNAALAHTAAKDSVDVNLQVRGLIEGMLICAAYATYEEQSLDENWKGACAMVASEGAAKAMHVLGHIPSSWIASNVPPQEKRSIRKNEDMDPEDFFIADDEDEKWVQPFRRSKNERFADLEYLWTAVRQAEAVQELLKHLPNPEGAAGNISLLESRMHKLPNNFANVTDEQIDEARKTVRAAVKLAIRDAVRELEEPGHFQTATILHNKITE